MATEELKCEMGVAGEGGEIEECGTTVSKKVADYSNERWGKVICYDCQHENPIAMEYIQEEQEKKSGPKDVTKEFQATSSDGKTDGKWQDDIISFETLLSDAHEKFNTKETTMQIKTEMLHHYPETKQAVFKAQVIVIRGNNQMTKIYEGHGDADQHNCQSDFIKPHYIRMAETRAIARALRWATNTAATAKEEKA